MSIPQSYKYLNKLHNKRILIFGGTSGLGYAVAEASIEHGCTTLILSSSSPPNLVAATTRLRTTYPHLTSSQLITHACDLTDKANLDHNIQTLLDVVTHGAKGTLDHVVFTAGDARTAAAARSLSDVTVAAFEAGQVVRNVAPAIVAKHLRRYMTPGPDSSFTLTSGFIFAKPPPGFGLFAASGVEGLARGLAVDMAPVRVNVVAPGVVVTEAMRGVPEEVLEALKGATTVGRLGRPEDVAEAYLYCMKDGFVTGSVVQSNGGRLLV